MTQDRELAACPRLGQTADPPHMIQPAGCNYTPDEVGRMLGNRVVQPHYAAWLVRKALLNVGLIDAEAARQQHAADQQTIAALRDELNRRTPAGEDARDAERLDWLASQFRTCTVYMSGMAPWRPNHRVRELCGQTFREAIDAAMAKERA